MHAPFVHLRLHSAYSLAESTLRIEELAALVSVDRQPAAAITDTNNMFGALEFSQAMVVAGVQPIIGTQMTLSDDEGSGEVVLLAMNETGYTNLCRLQSQALLKADATSEPSANMDMLAANADGLLVLSGGAMAGFVAAPRQMVGWRWQENALSRWWRCVLSVSISSCSAMACLRRTGPRRGFWSWPSSCSCRWWRPMTAAMPHRKCTSRMMR